MNSGLSARARMVGIVFMTEARDQSKSTPMCAMNIGEPRLKLPTGISDLSRYTRVYARTSATTVTGLLLRSRTPQRLIVDSTEELPTEESCSCKLVGVTVDLDALWAAGLLPAFNP